MLLRRFSLEMEPGISSCNLYLASSDSMELNTTSSFSCDMRVILGRDGHTSDRVLRDRKRHWRDEHGAMNPGAFMVLCLCRGESSADEGCRSN